ncbi:hypothetical protein, unlikely [Trypanosoma brucei brucei TREU927]|uniref:Secreted protein n=1 Tax=Trypanosoma brucei brucei (strain 927/4 GUTat10.1) TaxID=185431 RepID=Q38EA9_TRYB2|nr:hypothetical protein, unlikely [Trypanosoma brucei brucei TREU927]EAN76861.1 hypothetical protein, unlikely [Trypanosoma brucei brucei TREU927]
MVKDFFLLFVVWRRHVKALGKPWCTEGRGQEKKREVPSFSSLWDIFHLCNSLFVQICCFGQKANGKIANWSGKRTEVLSKRAFWTVDKKYLTPPPPKKKKKKKKEKRK